ncbi:unnamed protein product, partial [Prorocentrum cordatum]
PRQVTVPLPGQLVLTPTLASPVARHQDDAFLFPVGAGPGAWAPCEGSRRSGLPEGRQSPPASPTVAPGRAIAMAPSALLGAAPSKLLSSRRSPEAGRFPTEEAHCAGAGAGATSR